MDSKEYSFKWALNSFETNNNKKNQRPLKILLGGNKIFIQASGLYAKYLSLEGTINITQTHKKNVTQNTFVSFFYGFFIKSDFIPIQ